MAAAEQTTSMLGKIAGYVEILNRDPRSTAFVPLAEAYRQLGLLDDALEVAQKGVVALPNFSPGFAILGRIWAQRGELEEAEAAFERAHVIDPESLPALKGLARVCGLSGRRQRARELLERAIQLQPNDAAVKKMLASLSPSHAASAKRPVAPVVMTPSPVVAELDTGEGGENDDRQAPIATATIAEIYMKQGLIEKALRVYREMLAVHPDNAELSARCQELERQVTGVDVPSATSAASVEPAPVARADDQEQVLASLTRWLDAIRDRREDVR